MDRGGAIRLCCLMARIALRLLVVHTQAKAGVDFERFVPSGDLLGFYVQPLADIAGTFFLRSSFFGDVRDDDKFRSIGELKKGGIAFLCGWLVPAVASPVYCGKASRKSAAENPCGKGTALAVPSEAPT